MIKHKDHQALRDRFRYLLREELNLSRVEEDADGCFRFRFERMHLKLVFEEDDPSFVWIVHFGFYWVDGDSQTLARADRCISEVNYRLKCVKLARRPVPDKDGDHAVTASISFFADDVASHDGWTLERYLGQIKEASNLFSDLFKREDAQAETVVEATAAVRH